MKILFEEPPDFFPPLHFVTCYYLYPVGYLILQSLTCTINIIRFRSNIHAKTLNNEAVMNTA